MRRSLLLFATAASLACSQQGNKNTKEKNRMDGLVIGTFAKERAVLPGESLPVETVFENHGKAPLEVANVEGPSQFVYELLSAKDRKVLYRVSQDQRDRRRARDLRPPRDWAPTPLAAGEKLQRDEDLAELHNEDFAPGKYLIRTRYPVEGPGVESALSPFTILTPRIESFSSAVCGVKQVLVTVYAHRREDGGVLIMQRESSPDPRENIAFRRLQLDPGPPVQVAVAVDAMNAGNGRWFGWLRDGYFEAAVGWGNRLIVRPKPAKVGAADTMLLSPGFQVDVGVGLFGFIVHKNGTAFLRAIRATGQGLAPAFESPLGPSQGMRNIRWNYRPESGFAVFWQDAAGLVYRRTFNAQGAPSDAGTPAATSSMAPFSWGVTPLGSAELRTVVRAPDGRFVFRDLGAGDPASNPLPPMALTAVPDVPEPSQFVFCTTAAGTTKVVALGNGKLWSANLAAGVAGAWQPVADAVSPLYLHAFTPRGRTCWVEWLEKDIGLRRAALP